MSLPVVEIRHLYLNYALNIIPLAILYYDYALTLSREVEFFWPPYNPIGWVSFLFFLNRYVPIFGHIPIVLVLVLKNSLDKHSCQRMRRYKGYFEIVLQSFVAILCAMRVYALYNKNYYLLGGLVALISASIIVGCIVVAIESGDLAIQVPDTGIYGCNFYLGLSDEGGRFLSIAWGGVLAFDIIVFVLTLYKATKVGYNVPLIQVLVRDGSLYFLVLFSVNLANMLTLQLASTLLKNSAIPFANVLSTTLVSRMMLCLRSDNILHPSHRTVWTADIDVSSTLSKLSRLPTAIPGYSAEEGIELEYPSGRAVY
ncbi:hypothetical protein BJV78DRAFT_1216044 [Lactifluus subvellereus]|nr:hypothetical protein BJV78DRAFT_1216044 [Lactifluus subvellereus]